MDMVKPGRYRATPIDWGYERVGQKQTPACKILFSFDETPGQVRELTYTGWLTPAARPYTIKALMTCGFEDDDLHRFAQGAPGGALKTDQAVTIVVEDQMRDGKTHSQISGIYPVSGARFRELAAKPGLRTDIESLNLKGDILAARQALPKAAPPVTQPGDFNHPDDVGF